MGILPALLKITFFAVAIPTTIYFSVLGLLVTVPALQNHVFYLHRVTLTWFRDLNVPESFGFLPNQVTPFPIRTADGETLHAWHVLPLDLYRHHQRELLAQPSGFAPDISSRLNFQLLRDDPDARLVIYFHGTAGTLGSGWRPDSYRALYSAAPEKIHILTADYRGYGRSSGTPSEEGLLLDAIAITEWAIKVAGIPASRIVVFAQSLGTAVAISTVRHFAIQSPPVSFAGLVLVASFPDVATLLGTYRVAGVIPVLSPLSRLPRLLGFFTGFLTNTWRSDHRIAEFVRRSEKYHVTFIHAADDADIPYIHTEDLYWHAVNATTTTGMSYEELEQEKAMKRTDLGPGGSVMEWQTSKGVIREEIPKYGVHDRVMAYPVTALAVLRAFQDADPEFAN
ncbi:MAG: hypothetical protein M1819_001347 [Sarea resinae]|nr:MAG: hypothetical protein M1819_001347 [Sarea resinae]